jgi:cyclohexanone monooxygenase
MDKQSRELDVLIVGAGFAGMYAIYRMRALGVSCCAIEAGKDVGGTWYWNRYPGARCDVESMSYSYSFSEELQQEWHWTHRYATQPEILKYANHVADKFDLRRDIVLGTRVISASYDSTNVKWHVTTDRGIDFKAHYLIMATGCLSVPNVPEIPGLDYYAGEIYHTANWPTGGVDFSGLDVGIIGTGSSAIQSIPLIARQAKHLTVFQRTANFSIPAWNAPMPPEKEEEMKRRYPELREKSRNSYAGDYADEYVVSLLDLTAEQCEQELEKRWQQGGFNYQYAFADVMESRAANEIAAEFVRQKIRAKVDDPAVAELLCPKTHPFGSKRLCVDTDYYETYNRDNVTLVDIKSDPIIAFLRDGLQTRNSTYSFDALVLATGFDAMTGALSKIDITGKNSRKLRLAWKDGAKAFLGIAIADFPNMFIVNGPGSPSVLANMVLACEQHVEWISDLIKYARDHGITEIEADEVAQEKWSKQVTEDANHTLYPQANSWYLGANIPGKPRVFLPYVNGFKTYRAQCDQVARSGYKGFYLRAETVG